MVCLVVVNVGIAMGYGVVGVLVSRNLVQISVDIEVKSVSIATFKNRRKL